MAPATLPRTKSNDGPSGHGTKSGPVHVELSFSGYKCPNNPAECTKSAASLTATASARAGPSQIDASVVVTVVIKNDGTMPTSGDIKITAAPVLAILGPTQTQTITDSIPAGGSWTGTFNFSVTATLGTLDISFTYHNQTAYIPTMSITCSTP